MTEGCYVERRCALRWPLVMWGLGTPVGLVAVFVVLAVLVNPDWFVAAAFTPLFLPFMMGIALLYRNWPTGIRIDEHAVSIGAVTSRRAETRRPSVTHQNWGVFSCAWTDIKDVTVVTDPGRIRHIKKSPQYWTLSNHWAKPRDVTRCMAGVLTAPFMKAALIIDVGYAGVPPARRGSSPITSRSRSSRYGCEQSRAWSGWCRHESQKNCRLSSRASAASSLRGAERDLGERADGWYSRACGLSRRC